MEEPEAILERGFPLSVRGALGSSSQEPLLPYP